jgi:hypothetical protein
MRLLLGSRQSILSSLPLLLVNAVGIETTIVAGRAVRRYHRFHGAEHCRDAVPCREARRAQEAACSRSRGGQRMPPKSLSAKSKASVALSGHFDFLKWEVGRTRLGRKRHSPFSGASVFGLHNRMDHSGHATRKAWPSNTRCDVPCPEVRSLARAIAGAFSCPKEAMTEQELGDLVWMLHAHSPLERLANMEAPTAKMRIRRTDRG